MGRRTEAMQYRSVRTAVCVAVLAGMVLVGCRTTVPDAPRSTLRLLESEPLRLAEDCRVTGSLVVNFTVYEDGRAGDINPMSAPPCVQQALTAWVTSFRYLPPLARVPSSVEWLMVTARRGS